MTTEEQRIAIAEACGWIYREGFLLPWMNESKRPTKGAFRRIPPDYLNDLGSMHAAEGKLRGEKIYEYQDALRKVMESGNRTTDFGPSPSDFIWHATAAQRAEAFLRTIGKWLEPAQPPRQCLRGDER